jgi:hypothetical protein
MQLYPILVSPLIECFTAELWPIIAPMIFGHPEVAQAHPKDSTARRPGSEADSLLNLLAAQGQDVHLAEPMNSLVIENPALTAEQHVDADDNRSCAQSKMSNLRRTYFMGCCKTTERVLSYEYSFC